MTLEYDDQLVLARELSRDFQAVRLKFRDAQAGQAGHFSGVGSDDQRSSAAVQLGSGFFEGIERVRVHDQGLVAAGYDGAHEFSGLGMARDAWTHGESLTFEQGIEAESDRMQ